MYLEFVIADALPTFEYTKKLNLMILIVIVIVLLDGLASRHSTTYDIILDGEWITTVGPYDKSDLIEVEPGIHQLIFRNSETGKTTCLNEEIFLEPGKRKLYACSE